MPNNGMHPTRDTTTLIYYQRAGGRVMPGVRLLLRYKQSCWMDARARPVAELNV
jgi:hypothetical protein